MTTVLFAANSNQLDTDADGEGDVCDADDDNDGVPDSQDAFPLDPTEDTDTDNDGIGNNADTDDDNDGLSDSTETGLGTNPLLADTDGDGFDDGIEVSLGNDPLDPVDSPVWGDLNNDATVDVVDVLLAARAVQGAIVLTAEQEAIGRVAPLVNGQPQPPAGGVFGVADWLLIQRKAVGAVNF